jgi:hypothetical protein
VDQLGLFRVCVCGAAPSSSSLLLLPPPPEPSEAHPFVLCRSPSHTHTPSKRRGRPCSGDGQGRSGVVRTQHHLQEAARGRRGAVPFFSRRSPPPPPRAAARHVCPTKAVSSAPSSPMALGTTHTRPSRRGGSVQSVRPRQPNPKGLGPQEAGVCVPPPRNRCACAPFLYAREKKGVSKGVVLLTLPSLSPENKQAPAFSMARRPLMLATDAMECKQSIHRK